MKQTIVLIHNIGECQQTFYCFLVTKSQTSVKTSFPNIAAVSATVAYLLRISRSLVHTSNNTKISSSGK